MTVVKCSVEIVVYLISSVIVLYISVLVRKKDIKLKICILEPVHVAIFYFKIRIKLKQNLTTKPKY